MSITAQRCGRILFAVAIFLSAFLLFQVQPLIAKYILPWFGGSAAVWTTCMLFFQLLLLVGYAYAHANIMLLRPRWQAVLHVLLLAAALATLPIIPAERWKPRPGGDPTLYILLLLMITLGLPYFVLSSTAPLLQAWYARLNPGRSPWRLYALSNFASLLALLSYPFVFEPLISRRSQAVGWSIGLGCFAAVAVACAVLSGRTSPASIDESATPGAPAPPIGLGRKLLWLALPACASILLLATTNKISQDIAVVPFLWILPLALYLLTFVIAFDSPRWYSRLIFGPLLVVALAAATATLFPNKVSIVTEIAIFSAAMFVCCMVCHGEVARLRPDPRQLTGFYLTIAAGGALGGFMVAVVAPLVLNDYHELHIGLLLCSVLVLAVLFSDQSSRFYLGQERLIWCVMIAGVVGLGLALQTQATLGIRGATTLARQRNFYGVLRVYDHRDRHPQPDARLLQHGGITHGLQLLAPAVRLLPTTYYGYESGVGQILRHTASRGPRRIGAVGLGIGTIASYIEAGDVLRFYEISEDVERVARQYFSFLSHAQGEALVVLGDARLSMEREPPQEYDLLVLDAFSGDAIPVHLLTREAFDIYLRHLKPSGIIAVHISNHHLDLQPVVARLAEESQMQGALVRNQADERTGQYLSNWVILTPDVAVLRDALTGDVTPLRVDPRVKLWTDDYSSLFPVLK